MTKIFLHIIFIIAFISCKTNYSNVTAEAKTEVQSNEPKMVNGLIQDCPEELIINRMPSTNQKARNSQYYIYKGFRKEINEFDSVWVKRNCSVKTTVVQ